MSLTLHAFFSSAFDRLPYLAMTSAMMLEAMLLHWVTPWLLFLGISGIQQHKHNIQTHCFFFHMQLLAPCCHVFFNPESWPCSKKMLGTLYKISYTATWHFQQVQSMFQTFHVTSYPLRIWHLPLPFLRTAFLKTKHSIISTKTIC